LVTHTDVTFAQVAFVTPHEAFALLRSDAATVMVDVRSQAEWSFVGVPDLTGAPRPLLRVEWAQYPGMSVAADFIPRLVTACGAQMPARMLFLCRSGVRSLAAAETALAALSPTVPGLCCTNVAEGFEGDLDADGHRGRVNGWKAHGLPWRQT
jgi:rhodanese-related sulfurtransferase